MSAWTQQEAIALCREIEAICPAYGCHVALTGGLLYKSGPRKDCDLLFYRIRQTPKIDFDGLWIALAKIGLEQTSGFGWCFKGHYCGKPIDMFSPEEAGGEYPQPEQLGPVTTSVRNRLRELRNRRIAEA